MRTDEDGVLIIAEEEQEHRQILRDILATLNDKPSDLIDDVFLIIGSTVCVMCLVSPRWALNWVARIMEAFAVFNYGFLARHYPQWRTVFEVMGRIEKAHGVYFTNKSKYVPTTAHEKNVLETVAERLLIKRRLMKGGANGPV